MLNLVHHKEIFWACSSPVEQGIRIAQMWVQFPPGPHSNVIYFSKMILLNYLLYFFVGIIQDFLLTLNWRYVAKERPLPAVTFSFLTTAVSMLVFYNILTQLDSEKSVVAMLIYSIGVGAGTYIGMKFKITSN